MVQNIRKVLAQATEEEKREGASWYRNAFFQIKILSDKYQIDSFQVCGIVAALSPGREWEVNLRDTEWFLEAWTLGNRIPQALPKIGTYGSKNVLKACQCAAGKDPIEVLSAGETRAGNKVRNFYYCLVFHNPRCYMKFVCIDRHALSVACGEVLQDTEISPLLRNPHYDKVASAYREVAASIYTLPIQLQAITWLTWKRIKN